MLYVNRHHEEWQAQLAGMSEDEFLRIPSNDDLPRTLLVSSDRVLMVFNKRGEHERHAVNDTIVGKGSFAVAKFAIDLRGDHSRFVVRVQEDTSETQREYALERGIPEHQNVVRPEGHVTWKSKRGGVQKRATVTPLLEGGDLATVLDSGVKLTQDQKRKIVLGSLSGLEHVHASGIIHRDVKCENYFVNGTLCSKLADFGLAVRSAKKSAEASPFKGSPLYTAPEIATAMGLLRKKVVLTKSNIAAGREALSDKIDVWALGLVIWEVLGIEFVNGDEKITIQSYFDWFQSHLKEGKLMSPGQLKEEWLGPRPTPPEGATDSEACIVYDMLRIKGRITAEQARERFETLYATA